MNQKTALKVGTGKELKTWQTYKHYRSRDSLCSHVQSFSFSHFEKIEYGFFFFSSSSTLNSDPYNGEGLLESNSPYGIQQSNSMLCLPS